MSSMTPAYVGSCARTMFSATVITGMSMKCWCTIPIPRVDRVLRRGERDLLAVEQDLARVRVVQPVEDVHQRRLAGAVLAEQRVHLALAELEVDVVVGEHPGELLRDSAELEDCCRRTWAAILSRRRAGLAARPPQCDSFRPLEGGRRLDLAALDLQRKRVHLREVRLRHLRADLAERDAAVLQIEDEVVAGRRACRPGLPGRSGTRRDRRASPRSSGCAGRGTTGRRRRRRPRHRPPWPLRGRRSRTGRRPRRRPSSRRRSGCRRPPCTCPAR